MNIGLSTLYDIGSNYTIRLNDKEILVVEEDELRVQNKSSQNISKKTDLNNKLEKSQKPSDDLSEDEERLVKDLASRDSEVRAHESAHQAAGGAMVGAASYTYQQGPDGKMYAIGGEVSVSMSSGSSPQETISKAKQLAAAAMAAGDPSPQDYAVASSAKVMEMKAQQQKSKELMQQEQGKNIYASQSETKQNQNELNT